MKEQIHAAQGKKQKTKKLERKGGSVKYNEEKFTLMCKCTSNFTKHLRKQKTKPVLAYKVDPKLRENCEVCNTMPFVAVPKKTADVIEKTFALSKE